jgi:hypothetical protein
MLKRLDIAKLDNDPNYNESAIMELIGLILKLGGEPLKTNNQKFKNPLAGRVTKRVKVKMNLSDYATEKAIAEGITREEALETIGSHRWGEHVSDYVLKKTNKDGSVSLYLQLYPKKFVDDCTESQLLVDGRLATPEEKRIVKACTPNNKPLIINVKMENVERLAALGDVAE